MSEKHADYLGIHDGRQGRPFEPFGRRGFISIQPLRFLKGRLWDNVALAYVHALRPSHLRVVVGNGTQLDHQLWRVTVFIDREGISQEINQEVEVGLPDGIRNGCELNNEIGLYA